MRQALTHCKLLKIKQSNIYELAKLNLKKIFPFEILFITTIISTLIFIA